MIKALLTIVILLSEVVLLTRSCSPAAINCTAQYNLSIDDTIVINSTQYCHIDNCTVRIIETGDVLNIGTSYSDQYIIGCYNDTVIIILLEDDEMHDDYFCRPDQTMSATEHILDLIFISISLVFNIIIAIIIILLKLYSSLLFQLLLASTIIWVVVYTIIITYELSEFAFTAPAEYCYFIINVRSTLIHCARFIEFELILTICYIFYKSSHCQVIEINNFKWLCIYLIVAASYSIVGNIIRVILLFTVIDNLVTTNGHRVSLKKLTEVAPAASHIFQVLFFIVLFASLMIFFYTLYLVYDLNKGKLFKTTFINMLKILILIITTSGLSFVISTAISFDTAYIITGILVLIERCLLAYILVSIHKTI